MPTGVLIPVKSMSSRFRIGCVHVFGNPGNCSASSISACSFSKVMPGRHCSRGLSTSVVLTMPIGELSVGVVPRPTVPKTRSTSGKSAEQPGPAPAAAACASVIDMPGGAVGM